MGWNRVLDLLSLPVRMGLALGLSWLSLEMPMLAASILGFFFVLGLMGTALYLVIRWQVRKRARVSCHQCDYKVLRAAKLCPKCHAPTVLSSMEHLSRESRAVALHALADILQAGKEDGFTEQAWIHALEAEIASVGEPPSMRVSDPEHVFEVLLDAARVDGVISPREKGALASWGNKLGVPTWRRHYLMFRD